MPKLAQPIDVTCALFNGTRRRVVRTHTDTWSDFVTHRLPEWLEETRADKLALPAFVLAPVEGVRKDETTGAHTALVIDVDALPVSRKAFLRPCARYACAVYESPSSTPKAPRLRVIAALAEPIAPELVKAARRAFARDLGLDPAAAGVTKADAVSQIMFVGAVEGTPPRKLWAFSDGPPWSPSEELQPEAPKAKRAAADPAEADREPDELPELPRELIKAIEPKAGRQRYGGRDLMRGLGGYWARKGYHPDAIEAAALALPSSQPDKRAAEAREAAEQWYSGDERTAGAQEISRHFADALGESAGLVALAALDDAARPPAWAVRWAGAALARIEAGGKRTAWRIGVAEWGGAIDAKRAGRMRGALTRFGTTQKQVAEREASAAALEEHAPGLDGLDTDDEGRPYGTIDNVIRCVRHFLGHALALDTTTGRAVLLEGVRLARGPGETLEAGPWQDMYTTRLQAALNRLRMRHAYGNDTRAGVQAVASERPLDVLGDWLRGLAEAWDGEPRVDDALARYWRAEAGPLATAVSRIMLLGIAARGLKPGCQLDTVPVLIGQQGCGKGSSLKALVWGARTNWDKPSTLGYGAERRFSASKLEIGKKDALGSIRGHLVWELAELASVKRADIDEVKAWLTQTSDTFRPPFAHEDVCAERTVAFIGNLNPETSGHVIVNRDTTGGRRWAPIVVAPGYVYAQPHTHHLRIHIEDIARDGAQLLGEAARRVLDGEQWHPTESEIEVIAPAVAAVSEDPMRDDPWFAPVRAWARRWAKRAGDRDGKGRVRGFTIGDVFHSALDMVDVAKHGRAEALRIAGILRELGYVSRLSNGARRWVRAESQGSEGA